MRLLYIHCGLMPPPEDQRLDKFFHLSNVMEGDVLLPVWWKTRQEALEKMGPGSFPLHKVGNFQYHVYPAGISGGLREKLRTLAFMLRTGRKLHRQDPFDCIVTYGHTLTGLAGVLLKLVTGAKLIVEVNCEPGRALTFQDSFQTTATRLKQRLAILALHFSVLCADRVRLLYPNQLRAYPLLRKTPATVLHDFVATSLVEATEEKEEYILLVGYPWYIKGVDVLIKAFQAIAPEFPRVKLKILGFIPDLREIAPLAGDCPRIEFLGPRPQLETLSAIAKAMVLAHPARTEGMPRVLLEAMSAKTPIVASDVGGIPHYVRDGFNGLLCPPENAEALAGKLRMLLSDMSLRRRLGEDGFELVRTRWSEQSYSEEFHRMVQGVLAQPLPEALGGRGLL